MNVPSHPLIAEYATRHGLADGVRTDGRLTVFIDDKYRIHLLAARNGWLALSARLCSLPQDKLACERFMAEIGRLAAGMLSGHASACVVDSNEEALWLQQMIRPDTDAVGVDEAVGGFANALSFWTSAVRHAV